MPRFRMRRCLGRAWSQVPAARGCNSRAQRRVRRQTCRRRGTRASRIWSGCRARAARAAAPAARSRLPATRAMHRQACGCQRDLRRQWAWRRLLLRQPMLRQPMLRPQCRRRRRRTLRMRRAARLWFQEYAPLAAQPLCLTARGQTHLRRRGAFPAAHSSCSRRRWRRRTAAAPSRCRRRLRRQALMRGLLRQRRAASQARAVTHPAAGATARLRRQMRPTSGRLRPAPQFRSSCGRIRPLRQRSHSASHSANSGAGARPSARRR